MARDSDIVITFIPSVYMMMYIKVGVPPQVVRDIVGHSDVEVAMTIYAHASLDDKRTALRRLGDALGWPAAFRAEDQARSVTPLSSVLPLHPIAENTNVVEPPTFQVPRDPLSSTIVGAEFP
ncbi:hypothetical protein GCM10022224_017500 [Nonomuraea antimicrobica]|uniref:Phage integrase family protein n=1 Tax=Nonomuraea antimicrobica TaxID=561173 RepID=A0ABP7BAT4_9ACTN